MGCPPPLHRYSLALAATPTPRKISGIAGVPSAVTTQALILLSLAQCLSRVYVFVALSHDVLVCVLQVDEGWWIGEFNGERGLFPANYVEII